MSRARLPRRIAIFAALGLAVSGAAFSGDAWAQTSSGRERAVGARTTIGVPAANACSQYVAEANSSDEALAACNRALSTERLNRQLLIATHINRGALHLRRREGEAALADFDAVLAFDRRHAEAHLNRGAALVMLNRAGEAVTAITEALGLGVREPHKAYLNRGAAREQLGDVRGAYEDYNTSLEIQPDWGPANAELARFARARRERLAEVLGEEANGGK
ncbi:MAG TPA: tetratricopeptide repeat protein [Terricaulis sp.]|nr:tetratricopeptide repeat protein [Terricaulis sp.]